METEILTALEVNAQTGEELTREINAEEIAVMENIQRAYEKAL